MPGASPLATLHIAGVQNSITDIPSYLFGSNPQWHCKTDADLLKLFNQTFPESIMVPTECINLVAGWPDFIGIKDASGHGVGGVVVGENKECTPTVFQFEWLDNVKAVLHSGPGTKGHLTNFDLEMEGLLLLWLVMEDVCDIASGTHISLFNNNKPTVHLVERQAKKSSVVVGQLIQALVLRLKMSRASRLMTLPIEGVQNAMTDIPSCLFGSNP